MYTDNDKTKITHVRPADIESTSMEIIRGELRARGRVIPEEIAPVVMRVIHTTADFEYADTLAFSENVLELAEEAIRGGAHIVTDTNMALAGVSKRTLAGFGGQAHCFMADKDVAEQAGERQITRAAVSMEKAAELGAPTIFAIGNAPTALIRLRELIDEGFRPEVIIGVPVGFVNVVQAKELIMETSVPWIVNRGRKGGSTVAAAICNAILYGMDPGRGA